MTSPPSTTSPLCVRRALESCDGLIHLATSADPEAPELVHWRAVAEGARLVEACASCGVPRLVLPSSDWAEPRWGFEINAYGHSKRVFEALAAMYAMAPGRRAVALRYGLGGADRGRGRRRAPDWLRANHWDDARLVAEVTAALG